MDAALRFKRLFRRFIDLNVRLSRWEQRLVERLFSRRDGMIDFQERILPALLRPGMRVLDVGGGKQPAIDLPTKQRLDLFVVGLDVSEHELSLAPRGLYDRSIVGDVTEVGIDERFDLILSRTVLEHVRDNRRALANLAGALAEGGVMAHFMPCRNAPFAVINRLVGQRLASGMLYGLYPETKGVAGFPAYYDHCVPSKMQRLCTECGLEVAEVIPYYKSDYFRCFVPAFTVEMLRQVIVMRLNLVDWAEAFSVIACKRPCVQRAVPGTPGRRLHVA